MLAADRKKRHGFCEEKNPQKPRPFLRQLKQALCKREKPMSKTIFFLAKIFDNEGYAEDFISGNIFANRLSYFRELEEAESGNRSDKHEGTVSWYQPDQIKIELNGRVLSGLAAPASIQMHWHNHLNVFCIYAAHSGEFEKISEETLDVFKKQLQISEECLKLGECAVLVANVPQFIDRIKKAVMSNNYEMTAGLVEYYDPNTFHGTFSETESIFRKQKEYKHQKEYRFAFDTGLEGDDPLILNIGDISDIAVKCKVSDVNNCLDVKLLES